MPSWFVYILKSRICDFLYIGSTCDIHRRLAEHNNGFVQSTKAYVPLEIVAYIGVRTEGKARDLERYFKTGSGTKYKVPSTMYKQQHECRFFRQVFAIWLPFLYLW